MKPKYIIQGYQVSELTPEYIELSSSDYDIEDFLTDSEALEAGHLFGIESSMDSDLAALQDYAAGIVSGRAGARARRA